MIVSYRVAGYADAGCEICEKRTGLREGETQVAKTQGFAEEAC